ncbi:IS256 family transposase domain protein [Candidatus Megaera polyxenophila]|nr:IS256 family transposase domain protein [Candidatus Megaera polyxenophila]
MISPYVRGTIVSKLQGHLEEKYQTNISEDLTSTIKDRVIEEVTTWRNMFLDSIYPILYLDCIIHLKVRNNLTMINKAIYLAIGINIERNKELLESLVGKKESPKFWIHVVTELKNRGIKQIYLVCVNSIYPNMIVLLYIVHMVKNSVKYVSYKDLKAVTAGLKRIYTTNNKEIGYLELKSSADKLDNKYSVVSDIWQRNCGALLFPFLLLLIRLSG